MNQRIAKGLVAGVFLATVCGALSGEAGQKEPTRATESIDLITIMTFNTWQSGGRGGQPLSKTAEVIKEAKTDIVALQEIKPDRAKELAAILGWNHMHIEERQKCVMTHFDIVKKEGSIVSIKLNSGQEVQVVDTHLQPNPYQPYQVQGIGKKPFLKTEKEVIAAAEAARGKQIKAMLEEVKRLETAHVPIFFLGDFNEPTHLDWTPAAVKAGLQPMAVSYPASRAMADAGFHDAFRTVHTNEVATPGLTWTPTTKPTDPKDHHDRIDFIYFRGDGVTVKSAAVVGENRENADIVVSPYPSDHRAVVATFAVAGPK